MKNKLIKFLPLMLYTLLVIATPANGLVLKDIRTGAKKTTTRFVLEFDKKVEYSIFNLQKPLRLVIDTNRYKTKIAPQTKHNKGAIFKVRNGNFIPNVSRTVIELKYPVKITRVKLFGNKLVIDIKKSSSKAHNSQKKIVSKYWNKLEKRSKFAQKQNFESISKPTAKAGKALIIIDAGHGGLDSGSIGLGGHYEKHITLKIAKRLYRELKKSQKFNVGLTRNDDTYIPLRTRYRIAEKRQADFFISIHADKHRKSSVRGMSVYTLSNKASDREAAALARKENSFDEMVGNSPLDNKDDIKVALIDITQSKTMSDASRLSNSLIDIARANKIKILRNPHRFAGFAVLKSYEVPSILVESGYMSNRYDIRNLMSSSWQSRFAKSVRMALEKYFKEYPIKK